MIAFLFGFFFFQDKTSENSLYVYLAYSSLLTAFVFPLLAFIGYRADRVPLPTPKQYREIRFSSKDVRRKERSKRRERRFG